MAIKNLQKPCNKCGVADRSPSGRCRPCNNLNAKAHWKKHHRKSKPVPARLTKPCIKCGAVDRNKNGDCRPCDLARCKQYQKNNRETINARTRQWSKTKGPEWYETIRVYHQDWYQANKNRIREQNKKRYHQQRDQYLGYVNKRRARRVNAAINDLTVAQWEIIKTVYRYRCAYCGIKTATNIVPSCASCNRKKWTKAPLTEMQPLLII